MKISSVVAYEVLDSRGNPTIEAELRTEDGQVARAAVPSGASTGAHEAHELRDEDPKRYGGKGVQQAVNNVNQVIAPKVSGMSVLDQAMLDQTMIELDGTPTKSQLGANAILAVSMAATRAAALVNQQPLYAQIASLFGTQPDQYQLPIPMMNVLNGGKHAIKSSDFQEYMIMPIGAPTLSEAVRWGAEIFHALGKLLKKQGFATTVGDEGGYAPSLGTNQAPLDLILEAIAAAGYQPGQQVAIALDPAASELYQDNHYQLIAESTQLTTQQMVQKYQEWVEKYPIVSIEDGLAEDDWEGWQQLTVAIGQKTQIVGDDLFVTNIDRLQQGIDQKAGNSILIKLNQIGTVSESIAAIQLAQKHGYTAVVSHRSGETEDAFIADFVVGAGTGQIKTGSLSRSDRVAKYNQLMRIEHQLGDRAQLASFPFVQK